MSAGHSAALPRGRRRARTSRLRLYAGRLAVRPLRLFVTHVPPRRKGLSLVARVQGLVTFPETAMTARHVSGYVVDVYLNDAVQKSMYFRGTWEPDETRLIANALAPGSVFVDVGANAGHYALLAARHVGPTGRVHCIEAAPDMAGRLEQTARRNNLADVVIVHQVAAGDDSGSWRLQDAPGYAPEGSRFLLPDTDVGRSVDVVRLDDLLGWEDRIDVMKFDIEGSDLRALQGCRALIARHRPRLIIAEAADELLSRFGDSSSAMLEWMGALGYNGRWLEAGGTESPTLVFTPTPPGA